MPVLTDRDKVIFGHFLCAHSSARALKACIQWIKETKTTEIASLLHKNKNHSYQEQSMFFDVPLGLHGIISWYLYVALINYSPTINILIPESNCRNFAITTSLPCFYFSFSIICVFLTKWTTHKIANCLFSVHFWFWLIGSHQNISLGLTVAQGYTIKMIEIYSGNIPHPIFTANFSFWASSPHSAPLLLLFLTAASIVHLPLQKHCEHMDELVWLLWQTSPFSSQAGYRFTARNPKCDCYANKITIDLICRD